MNIEVPDPGTTSRRGDRLRNLVSTCRVPRVRRTARRAAAGVAIVAATSISLVACSSGSAASKPTFVYLQTNGDQSYFVDEANGAKMEAAKLGATLHVENENNSSATTITGIQQAIASGAQGLIVVTPAASLGPRMVKLAQSAGIPIIASDNGFAGSDGKQVPFAGINATAFGKSTGSMLVSTWHQLGWSSSTTYALIYAVSSLPTCNDRTNAEVATLKAAGFPASHIIDVPYDGTTALGYNNTGPVAVAHPSAKYWLLAGCNDDGPTGGAKALVAKGIASANVDAVGLGGDLACQNWTSGAPDVGFRATNYIHPDGIGAKAVQELYENVVNHKSFPANTYVSPVPITQSNYKSVDKSC